MAGSLALGVVSVALVASVALPALAHTQLTSSRPSDGGQVDAPPEAVVLTFSRPVEPLPNAVSLRRDDGASVPLGEPRRSEDGTTVTVPVEQTVAAGRYRIEWAILAEDSHPRDGTLTFRVADRAAPSPATSESSPAAPESGPVAEPSPHGSPSAPATAATGPPHRTAGSGTTTPADGDPAAAEPAGGAGILGLLDDVARVVFYIAALVATGLALFVAGPHRGEHYGASNLAGWAAGAAVIALVASAVEVAAHVGVVSRRGWAGIGHGGTWRAVLATGLGTALVVRSIGLLLLVGASLRRRSQRLPSGVDVGKLAGAALVVLSFQFVGHTASVSPAWAIRSADLVHAVAAAVWVGGVVGLVVSGRHDRGRRARVTAARFADAATVAVVGVGAAGVALALLNLTGPSQLVTTGYGRVLLAKLVLVAVLGALGAHNHYRVVPALHRGDAGAVASLRRTVGVETGLMVAVLGLTALLVNLSPS